MQKIAITGIGIVSPSGLDKRKFWSNVKAGRSAVERITRFDSSRYTSQVAGHVHELDAYSNVSSRLLKKIDSKILKQVIGTDRVQKIFSILNNDNFEIDLVEITKAIITEILFIRYTSVSLRG